MQQLSPPPNSYYLLVTHRAYLSPERLEHKEQNYATQNGIKQIWNVEQRAKNFHQIIFYLGWIMRTYKLELEQTGILESSCFIAHELKDAWI